MDSRQLQDSFVDAGAFFSNQEVGDALQPNNAGLNIPEMNVSTRSSLRNKLSMLDSSSVQTRRRSQRFVAIENEDSDGLIGAIMSPTTSSGVAAKREATRFPSVMFSKQASPATASQKNTSSPLPGPKSTTSSYVSTRRTIRKEEEEDSAASRPQNMAATSTQQQHLPFNRSSVASELYQSATSHMSTSTDDLSALTKAVNALKTSSLAMNSTTQEQHSATTGSARPATLPSAYVPLPKPAARIPIKPTESASLDSLQQRVARITLANAPAAIGQKKAVVIASPKIERYSPVGIRASRVAATRSTTPAKPQQHEKQSDSYTPPMRSFPPTPGAPANTPASPLTRTLAEAQQLRQQYTTTTNTSGTSPAQIEAALAAKYQYSNQEETNKDFPEEKKTAAAAAPLDDFLQNIPSEEVLLASPLPTISTTAAPATGPPPTVYDGDADVVMGDATPGGDSIAMATTVPRRESFSAGSSDNNNNSSGSSGVRVSSRFKIEALRQGVTPLRVRQHRASFSPSNAGVNVEIESARKADAPKEHIVAATFADANVSLLGAAPTVNAATKEASPSPTMSSNPLATLPTAPAPSVAAASAGREHSASPAVSSNSAISNNPLFAGTSSHPTPPSVTTRRPSLGMAAAAGLRTPSTGGASAASEGIKLAEKLHAAAEKLQTPVNPPSSAAAPARYINNLEFSGTKSSGSIPSSVVEDATFQFQGDVIALLQALNTNTPQQEAKPSSSTPIAAGIPTNARAFAAASTEERPKPAARRHSSSFSPSNPGAAILDLAGFTEDGERTAPGQGTPLLARRTTTVNMNPAASNGTSRVSPLAAVAAARRSSQLMAPVGPPIVSGPEVALLHQQIADLESERKDAAGLLSGYQGTIAELQDRHSAAVIKLQAENAMLKSESERLRSERSQIHSQFEVLYREKYAPLKTEAAALRRGSDALRTRLAEEGGKVKRIAQVEAELAASQAATAAAQQEAVAFKAKADAAKQAEHVAEQRASDAESRVKDLEQKWVSKFAAESSKAEQALKAKTAEISAWKDKHAAMARQYDDAVHRAHLAQAARERKAAEVGRKEEEICRLDVQLGEYERVLGQYRAENDKFAATKEKYKAAIASLEQQLAEKEAEKQTYFGLYHELISKSERST